MLGDDGNRVRNGLRFIEPLAQPAFKDRPESEIGLDAVKNLRTGIDGRFDRIGSQEVVAKSVDRRAGELIEPSTRIGQPVALGFGHTLPETKFQFDGYLSGQKRIKEPR